MSIASDPVIVMHETSEQAGPKKVSDRRVDVDAKQVQVARLLEQVGCEGLLVLDQSNIAWLTSGGAARNLLDPNEMPGLYYAASQRWLLASNVESQRMFDEEIDNLGFMLKEWPWHWGREQLLAELCEGRAVAADVPFRDAKNVADQLRLLRLPISRYEQACYKLLGQILAYSLEATCRNAEPGDSERELAGQLSRRLVQRGAAPVAISVAADGRSRIYRRHGFTSAPVRSYAVLAATARKYGLYATASRAFSFGPPEEKFLKEHLSASKVAATYIASTWPDAGVREILSTGRRVQLLSGFEHEWLLCPQGQVTGRNPVEELFVPDSTDLLRENWAVTWTATIGAAASCDTFLIAPSGPRGVTPTEHWPQVSVRISGNEVLRPHILER